MALLVSTGDAYVPLASWTLARGIRQGDECLELVAARLVTLRDNRLEVLGAWSCGA